MTLSPLSRQVMPLGTPQTASPFRANLTFYYHVDEVGGNRSDSAGSNTLTDNNTVGSNTGLINLAAEFIRANSESLTRASTNIFSGATKASVSLWIKRRSAWAANESPFAIWGGGGNRFLIEQIAAGSIRVFTPTSGSDFSNHFTFTTTLSTSAWAHIGVVYDGTLVGNANRLKFYRDGTQLSIAGSAGSVPASLVTSSLPTLTLGAVAGSEFCDMLIEEIAGWTDRALTGSEITQIYNSGAGLLL